MTFPQFASLPQELQLQVWEACKSSPAMHIFDVCSPNKHERASPAESSWADRAQPKDTAAKASDVGATVFLDALCTTPDDSEHPPRVTSYPFDPSAYHFDKSLTRATRASQSTMLALNRGTEKTIVHLPRQHQTIELPKSDVVMLRFRKRNEVGVGAARTVFRDDEGASSALGEVLEGQWSPQMATTLRSASKIALDLTEPWIAELGGELAYEEITFLACTLQHDLEVLYLVDNCVGRCEACGSTDLRARDLQKKGTLWKCLNYQNEDEAHRQRDVIEGVSKRYIEIRDFERLGWDDTYPCFIFARMIDELIRGQQHGESKGKFKGVRILVAEDEPIDDAVTEMHVRCGGRKSQESVLGLAMGLLPAFGGVWNE